MASIVDISPPQSVAPPSVRKIRIASRGLEWLFTGLLAAFITLTAVGFGVLFFYHGTMIAFGPKGGVISTGPVPTGYLALRDWRFDQRLAYAPVWIARSFPTIGLFSCLRGLFRLYGDAEVFTERTARLIRWMGIWLVADAVAPLLCHLALSATGYEIDKAWAHMTSVQEAVLGAVVFVIALVMQAGHEIEQDREGFI
ncbi:DUF2975 domain-containing protein [Phenylobacterium sp.]|uniref:DUF2975 domain-containing protein n=1 Tax=Phenylobacterium sp. TaxID=1871053 RepID=UPI0011F729C7|nr:DUF2975 domain-containing protein [Phenylobacterium sp.]THD59743.1 MAG: DUF2975 domain-containing protein [Phenylobacterium sp.]